ncbi:hypothetical protein [Actinomadura madurae]|uniref:hypothetical protein n=1 Tax=Actinomadura madurae TaxID=1993 RepID=UPI0020D1F6AD|nr:hypothetical protein [Actinomadura madurae]MCP9947208.1 hypothetical protein [Actinomadura madurae]MCP9963973.1 hypothetical protein [Actinomadura madurae]MCP9976448.1 hypothetical protein [Actinomadura madurae]MCQ0012641.1 hypothetical protein [Actinomadura madurae]
MKRQHRQKGQRMTESSGITIPPPTPATPTGPEPSSRPGFDHHATNTTDHAPREGDHPPERSQTLSAPRRLTITTSDDHAEAIQFTSGAIAGWWDSDGLYAWLNLDAVREHLPDAEITWLDDAVEQASQEAPDA